MVRTTMREPHMRRLEAMTIDAPPTFDAAYRHASLAAQIGETVRDTREAAGLSQNELATRMGTGTTAVARIETGHSRTTLAALQKVADSSTPSPAGPPTRSADRPPNPERHTSSRSVIDVELVSGLWRGPAQVSSR